MFIFTYYGWLLTLSTIKTGQITTGVMMPMWIPYIGIPIGCFLMGMRFLQRAVNTFKTEDSDRGIKKELDDAEIDISRL